MRIRSATAVARRLPRAIGISGVRGLPCKITKFVTAQSGDGPGGSPSSRMAGLFPPARATRNPIGIHRISANQIRRRPIPLRVQRRVEAGADGAVKGTGAGVTNSR